jgi:hypothetical protein
VKISRSESPVAIGNIVLGRKQAFSTDFRSARSAMTTRPGLPLCAHPPTATCWRHARPGPRPGACRDDARFAVCIAAGLFEPVSGPDLPAADASRRLSTTVADLEASTDRLRAASPRGRPPIDAVRFSVLIGYVELCNLAEVASASARIARSVGLSTESLDECPYALIGDPHRIADLLTERRERLGLDTLILAGSIDPRPFCEQVLPRHGSGR